MDTEKLSKKIRTRFDHQQARLILRETYQAKMLFAYEGGMWQAGPELILLCDACGLGMWADSPEKIVLEDYYNTPISVDASELKKLVMERWQEQMNAWQSEYNEISKNR
jgi:hypothetical protein